MVEPLVYLGVQQTEVFFVMHLVKFWSTNLIWNATSCLMPLVKSMVVYKQCRSFPHHELTRLWLQLVCGDNCSRKWWNTLECHTHVTHSIPPQSIHCPNYSVKSVFDHRKAVTWYELEDPGKWYVPLTNKYQSHENHMLTAILKS